MFEGKARRPNPGPGKPTKKILTICRGYDEVCSVSARTREAGTVTGLGRLAPSRPILLPNRSRVFPFSVLVAIKLLTNHFPSVHELNMFFRGRQLSTDFTSTYSHSIPRNLLLCAVDSNDVPVF
jgi:hypothetical protein